jgi:hypothetical protein
MVYGVPCIHIWPPDRGEYPSRDINHDPLGRPPLSACMPAVYHGVDVPTISLKKPSHFISCGRFDLNLMAIFLFTSSRANVPLFNPDTVRTSSPQAK